MRAGRPRSGTALLLVLPILFLGYFFLYPLIRILWLSLGGEGWIDAFTRRRFIEAAWFTLWQASLSTVLTVMAALPLTWVVSRFNFRGKSLVRAFVTIPFVLPTVVVGAAFLAVFDAGLGALIAAHVFYNIAVVVRTVGGVWSRIDPAVEQAAAVLGASPIRRFREVVLPLIKPALASASAIVFLFCFTSFGTVLVLGQGRLRTLEVEIYQQAVNFLDLPVAAALSLIQLVTVAAILVVSARTQKRASALTLASETRLPAPKRGGQRRTAGAILTVSLGLLAIPLVGLVGASLDGGGIGWRSLVTDTPSAVDPLPAIGNSLGYALIASLLAVVVGGLAASWLSERGAGGWFDLLLMLPLGTSAVTIGFGFLLALDRPIDLRGTAAMVPLAHALVAIPFVVRATLPLLRSIKRELREAAAVLGASPGRVWREIDLPIVTRALAVGAGFAAVVSLGEFGATSFVVRPASTTVPALIFRYLGRPGSSSFATAMALAVVLAAMTALIVLLIDRVRGAETGMF
ncbi:MAG TPA: iron ABC transporter permease [Acidimicrobiia bacterium]|nr:iron ABC transporter permease [Acidimicrobiia bacterium]